MTDERPPKLRPVPYGGWWKIGPTPDLTDVLPPPPEGAEIRNEPNDHHIFQDAEGKWNLWACVRRTAVGRILCHWQAESLTDSPWERTGQIVRADRDAGESIIDFQGQEFIQSPFCVREGGTWYMFYGGYATGVNPDGEPTTDYSEMENQISLMTSPDGKTWTRHRDAKGRSRAFAGPGAVRDPCFSKFDGLWYVYYAGHHNRDRKEAAIYVRTSEDLLHWSDWGIAQHDTEHGRQRYIPESPVVVRRGGYYYLFRTHGPSGGTYVYRSADPRDFGQGEVCNRLVTRLPVIAPEIIVAPDGQEYISKIHDSEGYGIQLSRLRWESDEH